jgi:hypothetical protein
VDYYAGLKDADTRKANEETESEELTEQERARKVWEETWEARKLANFRKINDDLAEMERVWKEEKKRDKEERAKQLAEMRRKRDEERQSIAKPGYLGRSLSLPPERDIQKIWKMAEERLGIDREMFSLVHESHYLPESGLLEKPVQIFEIRIRGRGGGKLKPARCSVRKESTFIVDIEDSDMAIGKPEFRTEHCSEESV